MSVWDKLKSWFDQDGVHFISQPIPKAQVDVAYDDAQLVADRGYLRIWLVEMFLTKSRTWFQEWQPAVHGRIKLAFADQSVEIVRLAAPSGDKFRASKAVLSNYVLLDLVPFRGGTVEIEAGLLALRGADRLGTAISVVSGFADLVAPPLAQALEITSKVKDSITKLFGDTDEVHLGVHQTLGGTGGANPLRPGYVAMIRATDRDVERGKLSVKNDTLCDGKGAPLTGVDYMLLRIETAANRDDFQHFSDIAQLRKAAIEAYLTGDTAKGEALVASAIAKIASHPDLINADRRALAKLVRDDIAEYKDGGHGAAPGDMRPWDQAVAAFAPVTDHAPVSVAELLAS
ncbi:MAG: hypothetical protein E6J90_33970 [Deltaproteobacteria bacterium]|nr:MAG: hypothetical protein E6J90_33970 [Deltaproteobacteria bacterium]